MELPDPIIGDVFTIFDYLRFIGVSLGGLFKGVADLLFGLFANSDAMVA
jgi:hypothetical protein